MLQNAEYIQIMSAAAQAAINGILQRISDKAHVCQAQHGAQTHLTTHFIVASLNRLEEHAIQPIIQGVALASQW